MKKNQGLPKFSPNINKPPAYLKNKFGLTNMTKMYSFDLEENKQSSKSKSSRPSRPISQFKTKRLKKNSSSKSLLRSQSPDDFSQTKTKLEPIRSLSKKDLLYKLNVRNNIAWNRAFNVVHPDKRSRDFLKLSMKYAV